MPASAGTYVPPSLDDVNTEPAPSTEHSNAPLLVREERSARPAGPDASPSALPAAALQYPGTHVVGIPAINVPEVPDAMRMWREVKKHMHLWLATSVATIVFFLPLFIAVGVFFPSLVASILSLMAASMYLCSCWHTDMATQVRSTVMLGTIAAILDAWNGTLAFMILCTAEGCDADDGPCRALYVYLIVFTICIAGHCGVTYSMVHKARDVMRVLNPVSSGLVRMDGA